MLRFLKIRHLAVIHEVELEFGPGLNVLTGETGAGKSILVQAVSLLLGGRASGDLVRTGEEAATVEAIFESGGREVLIRREVTALGRSRAFVDGVLATAGTLKELSTSLIELHGQHEHQTLLDPQTHLPVLDLFGALDPLLDATSQAFAEMRAAGDELAQLRQAAANRDARQELAAFQLAELERAAVQPGEDASLSATRQILANAERVERLCAEGYAALYDQDDAVLATLGGVWRRVAELATIDPRFAPYLETRESIKSQLEDLAVSLRRYTEEIEFSPARLQQVEDRLALLEGLKKKYGPTLEQVTERRDALVREISEFEHRDERIAELEARAARARETYLDAARSLSAARRKAARSFAPRLEALLGELAMEGTTVDFRFEEQPLSEPAWSADGIDRAEFFVSPNVGEDLRPLARIVSGGELSRIMLAIKTLTAVSRRGLSESPERPPGDAAPGLIFDEVDAGIGGRVADVVGRKLRALGSRFQVLCITHLPQIAACADVHFQIEKRVEGERTRTRVSRLDAAGRVEEIGRMLGGTVVTAAVRESARELLAASSRGEGAKVKERKRKGESETSRRLE